MKGVCSLLGCAAIYDKHFLGLFSYKDTFKKTAFIPFYYIFNVSGSSGILGAATSIRDITIGAREFIRI